MKEYRYFLSATSQFYFCGVPLRLDTTPKCPLNCLYCFAMSRGGRRTSRLQIARPSTLLRKIKRAMSTPASQLDVVGEMLKRRVPVHFGGLSDPFCAPRVSETSRKMLKYLADYDYPTIISTKETTELTKDSTLSILGRLSNLAVQISFTTLGSRLASDIEPGAPPPMERLKAVMSLTNMSIPVIIRLQPLLPFQIEEACTQLIPAVAEAGASHVIVEFLKIPVEKDISQVEKFYLKAGHCYGEFYDDKESDLVGREWLLPKEFRWKALQPLIRVIHQNGMTYGAGDYGLNHLGDTKCCCGIDNLEGFSNWFRGNIANIIREASDQRVAFDQYHSHWYPKKSIRSMLNSNSRVDGMTSMLDYLRLKWNSPGTINSPDAFLGIHWKGDYDNEGNCVYFREEGVL